MPYKILIVEDDATIAGAVSRAMEKWGCTCLVPDDFREITGSFTAFSPDIVLLDISLPYFDGYHWCAEIRRLSKVPIVFLSSTSDNMNIVMAIAIGADDFIAKPFDVSVLVAKIQALLRRVYDFSAEAPDPRPAECGGVILNAADCSYSYHGIRTELTKNETRILEVLFADAGKTVSREKLMQRLWETDSYIDENTLTVNMTRLRKKLSEAGVNNLIITKKGIGYMVEK